MCVCFLKDTFAPALPEVTSCDSRNLSGPFDALQFSSTFFFFQAATVYGGLRGKLGSTGLY